jgi:hypothetical protein
VDGELMLGMMWQSPKARDLLRDPRCVVHSVVSDRQGTEGDFKLYARALDVPDPARRERHRETIKARIDWEPAEPGYHLFGSTSTRPGWSSSGMTVTASRGIPNAAYGAGRSERARGFRGAPARARSTRRGP